MMGRKVGRPPNEHGPTRERLLAAAAELFNADGYFGTDSNKIARSAGFAPATFYKHFADKKAIFLEAYALWVEGDWEIIERFIAQGGEAQAIARRLVRAYLARHAEWTGFRLSMQALAASDAEARRFHLNARSGQLERMAKLLVAYGAPKLSRADLLFSFLCVERTANAVTDGDVAAAGAARAPFVSRIEGEIVFLLTGERQVRGKLKRPTPPSGPLAV